MGGAVSLGVSVPGLIASLITFVVLWFLLNRLLFKPVLGMFDRREQAIREAVRRANEVKAQSQAGEEQVRKKLDDARAQAQAIIDQGLRQAAHTRDGEIDAARKTAEQILAQAKADVQAQRQQAVAELRRLFPELVYAAAEKILNGPADKQAGQKAIDDTLARVGRS